jgi:predicted RND superfamily exporter protein
VKQLIKLAEAILKHRKTVLIIFGLAALLNAFLMTFVNVNYKLKDYLPEDAPSTVALQTMEEHFAEDIPNLSIYIREISIPEALEFKEQLAGISGVKDVLWLDDVVDVYMPLEIQDQDLVEGWYKDGGALFSVCVEEDRIAEHIKAIKDFVGERGIMAGEAVNQAKTQTSALEEVPKIMLFLVPLVLIILFFSTSSWFEPILFSIIIGVAILINEGTNIFLGEVSFVTRSCSAILQLAVSMDYAIFLLHSFARFRRQGLDIQKAMSRAMVHSFSAIAASALTTIIGFSVLALMRFQIGVDMGIVLAKGITASLISVIILLPVLATATTKVIDRTHHRPLIPSFAKAGKVITRICIPFAIIAVLMIVPAFLGQQKTEFIYGSSGINSADSQTQKDADEIDRVFGEQVQLVILVPRGDIVGEKQLSTELEQLEKVTSVISYPNLVGTPVPEGFLSKGNLSQFRSENYSRLILYVATSDEGEEAFKVVEEVRQAANRYFPGNYHLTGESVVHYDLKETIVADNKVIRVAVVVAIGLVLLFTFRSVSIPIVLLLTIQGATWINLSIPYLAGDTLNYLGYQIVSSVQLGATVDYGILFMTHYMRNRGGLLKKEAVSKTITDTAATILTPAGILTLAGMILGLISSNGIISQLGIVLGRGALFSAAMVLLVLPGLLCLFDKVIQKTTLLNTGPKFGLEGGFKK